jgi:hypothetical protein
MLRLGCHYWAMIWIVEAALNLVASAASDEVVGRAMRRGRQRRGEPEPEHEELTLHEVKKEWLWTTGLVLILCAGLAAVDSWSPWFSWSLAAVGLATLVIGLVVRRRLDERGE